MKKIGKKFQNEIRTIDIKTTKYGTNIVTPYKYLRQTSWEK